MEAMKRLLYVIGEPGIGKSTAVRALTSRYDAVPQETPVPHINYADRDGVHAFQQVGRDREGFGGTDALSMSIIDQAEQFLLREAGPRVLLEGSRLANTRFLSTAEQAGYLVTLLHLDGPGIAAARRTLRGSKQDPTWVRGRRTAAENLMRALVHSSIRTRRIRLNGNESPDEIATALAGELGLATALERKA